LSSREQPAVQPPNSSCQLADTAWHQG
jgi:hypothetical protein